MKFTVIFFSWFILSLATVGASVYTLISSAPKPPLRKLYHTRNSILSSYTSTLSDRIVAEDARPAIVEAFLAKNKAVLTPYDYYARFLVAVADKYRLDFRLIPSIGMQESNLCRKAPRDSYNCWGHGIYGGKVTVYPSFEEAIESVAKTLAKYSQNGLASPEEIMRKYTPQSEGEWAASVLQFMNNMK